MNIALLNTRIAIQASSVVADSIGNRKLEWHDFFQCAATVSGESNGEAEEAGATVDMTSVDFTVRYCSETASVTPTEYRVIFRDELYDITGVDHMNFKRKAIKLKCRKVRR